MYGPGGPGFPGGRPGGFGFFGHGGPMKWGPGYKFPGPVRRAQGGNVATSGDSVADIISDTIIDFNNDSLKVRKTTGSKAAGFISASRMFFTESLHYNMFMTRVNAAEKDLSEKRITAKQAKYRKLKAADKFHTYLYKVGYYTAAEYKDALEKYASQEINDFFIYQQVLNESKVPSSRSR